MEKLSKTKFILLALGFVLEISSCASPNNSGRGRTNYSLGSEPEPWEQSRAAGAAYAADDFTFRKRQPIGAKNEYPFYFKHCEENGTGSWYSKTSYECTGPLGR